jgi:hypothetical protein
MKSRTRARHHPTIPAEPQGTSRQNEARAGQDRVPISSPFSEAKKLSARAALDDIAAHAGLNIATAYRHFANKQELADAFLEHTADRAAAAAEQVAALEDPWTGLNQFLERLLELEASNRSLTPLPGRLPADADLRDAAASTA